MRLDGRKDIRSVKSTRSVLHSELKAHALPSLNGNSIGHKTSTNTYTRMLLKWIQDAEKTFLGHFICQSNVRKIYSNILPVNCFYFDVFFLLRTNFQTFFDVYMLLQPRDLTKFTYHQQSQISRILHVLNECIFMIKKHEVSILECMVVIHLVRKETDSIAVYW